MNALELQKSLDTIDEAMKMILNWYNIDLNTDDDILDAVETIRCNHSNHHASTLDRLHDLYHEKQRELSNLLNNKTMPGPRKATRRRPMSPSQERIHLYLKEKLQSICDEYADTHEVSFDINEENGAFQIELELLPYRLFSITVENIKNPAKTLTFEELRAINNTSELYETLEEEGELPLQESDYHTPPKVFLRCSSHPDENIGTWNYISNQWDLTKNGRGVMDTEAELHEE